LTLDPLYQQKNWEAGKSIWIFSTWAHHREDVLRSVQNWRTISGKDQ